MIGQAQGAIRVDLETAHTNVTAQSVYEALGYELDNEFGSTATLPQSEKKGLIFSVIGC